MKPGSEQLADSFPPPRIKLSRIVAPRSIAVIGASDDVGKFGGRVVHYLIKHGFDGMLVPINPRRPTIRGLRAYPKVSACPERVDVAILAVPASSLLEQVEDCAAADVGACIVITGKLAEADAEGAALQDRVVDVARRAGMRLVGPNCLGIVNPVDRIALTSSLSMERDTLRAGGIGIVSQSGALMGTLISRAMDYGAGFSRGISVGNQADLDLCDFFEYLVDDPATGVICLYVEGVPDGARFLAIGRRARAAGKPVLVVKIGRSEAGARSARSHTASLAGSYPSFVAAASLAGMVMMDDPTSMVLAADALLRLPRIAAPGRGIAAIASSGGSTANLADQLEHAGLPGPTISAATRAVMEDWMLPAHVSIPVDSGSFTNGSSREGIEAILRAFTADPAIGAIVYPMTTQPGMAESAAMLPAVAREGGKPILFVMTAGDVGNDARARLTAADFPYYDRISDVLAIVRALDDEAKARSTTYASAPSRPAGAGPVASSPVGAGALTESEAKRLVGTYGVHVAPEALVRTADDAAVAAGRIGYPVVLKGVSRAVVHKSDAGLVCVGLADEAALREAFAAVQTTLDRIAPDANEGCVVQEMVRGEAELILGTQYDADFGPMVLVGFGGILVEVLKDVRLAPAPVSHARAHAMLRELAFWPVLQGVRGRPALDVEAAADALVRLSWLAADLGPRLVELDINPLIVRAANGGAVAADARATLRERS
jgi:acyl-CoA synthetase (NDP forming)